jgi:DNA-binding beta-propeller fold protein YncE
MKRPLRPFLLLLLLLPLSACAPAELAGTRYFWPPGGIGEPRIEFITFYQSDADVKRGKEGWMKRAILGDETPAPLFSRPFAVAVAGERAFVTDIATGKVMILDLGRKEVRVLGDAPGGEYRRFSFPGGLATTAEGRLYVVDSLQKQIHLYDRTERLLKSFTAPELARPLGIVFDDARRRLYVADPDAHRVAVFDADGTLLRTFGRRGAGPGEFNFPLDLDLDPQGNLYVLDSMNARVQVFDPEGEWLRAFGERGSGAGYFQTAKSIAVSPSGPLYVTDSSAHRILVFDGEGVFLLRLGGQYVATTGVAPGGFFLPQGIAVDGDDGIWVVDSLNQMIQRFQYLNERYLAEHPILPGQAFRPEGLQFPGDAPPPPKTRP